MGQVQQRVLRAVAPLLLLALSAAAQRFRPDDPLWREPRPRPVRQAAVRALSDYYDFFLNTFTKPEEKPPKGKTIRALSANTLGEVPDSAWYTSRHGRRRMTLEELLKGPDTGRPPAPGTWKVTKVKSEGVTPGLEIDDPLVRHYWLKFDPVTNPEMATAADVIGTTFFHALGYNVPEYYLVTFDRPQLEVAPKSTYTDALGHKRALTERDVDEVLFNVPRDRDRRYRAVASLAVPGKGIGKFRYHGTRADDPNDTIPHENRRELRGLFLFCAWLGHDDSRAINTYDSLVEEDGVPFIKHYLMDFGSILGSASVKANSARSGHERLFALKPAVIELLTLGLYVPRWARARFPKLPAGGRFEHEIFEPERYKTEYRNPAFENRLPDDCFWAARQVMAFDDAHIRAIVAKGGYNDPRSADWVSTCLIARRDRIGKTYFATVLPLDGFEVRDGRLVFEDLAVLYKFTAPREYEAAWSRFDNLKESKTALPGRTTLAVPPEARQAAPGEYFCADLRAADRRKTVTVYLRQGERDIQVVGVDRAW